MAKARVTLIHSAIAELLKSDGVRSVLTGPADRVAEAARASAPVDSGTYRDGIVRESATTDRAVELVVATDWKSRIIESRTGNLARALGSA